MIKKGTTALNTPRSKADISPNCSDTFMKYNTLTAMEVRMKVLKKINH